MQTTIHTCIHTYSQSDIYIHTFRQQHTNTYLLTYRNSHIHWITIIYIRVETGTGTYSGGIHIHRHIHIHIYKQIHTQRHTYTHKHKHIHIHTEAHMQRHTYIQTHTGKHIQKKRQAYTKDIHTDTGSDIHINTVSYIIIQKQPHSQAYRKCIHWEGRETYGQAGSAAYAFKHIHTHT